MTRLLLLLLLLAPGPSRAADPVDAPRVARARAARGGAVRELFTGQGLAYPPQVLHLRVIKDEDVLEVWAGARRAPLTLVKRYPICARSGELGPKRRQGDLQVPEGFYRLERYNPWSNFHLSLGVDYPNASDRILGRGRRLGGDIFIHGSCVTIGCIPIEDEPIEELFLMALDTHRAGRTVSVHIFPARLDEAGLSRLQALADGNEALRAFWADLAPAWEAFEREHRVPRVKVDPKSGRYRVLP